MQLCFGTGRICINSSHFMSAKNCFTDIANVMPVAFSSTQKRTKLSNDCAWLICRCETRARSLSEFTWVFHIGCIRIFHHIPIHVDYTIPTFLDEAPHHFNLRHKPQFDPHRVVDQCTQAEISKRMVVEWATRSGIFRQKVPGIKGSNDRPGSLL